MAPTWAVPGLLELYLLFNKNTYPKVIKLETTFEGKMTTSFSRLHQTALWHSIDLVFRFKFANIWNGCQQWRNCDRNLGEGGIWDHSSTLKVHLLIKVIGHWWEKLPNDDMRLTCEPTSRHTCDQKFQALLITRSIWSPMVVKFQSIQVKVTAEKCQKRSD